MSAVFPRLAVVCLVASILLPSATARAQTAQADELPAVLSRTPAELPRAAAAAWEGLFELDSNEAIGDQIGAEAVRSLAAIEGAYRTGRYPEALEGLYPLLEERPDLPPALMIMGTTYFRLRRYGDTIVAFERFLEVAPSQAWRTQALAHAYYSLGEYDRALGLYESVLAGQPNPSAEAVRGLALTHMRLGEEDLALELLKRVVDINPANWEALAWAAQIHYDRGELEQARTQAEAARAIAAHEPRPWFILTNVLFELGEDREAEAAQTRWRELDALMQSTRRVRGLLLYNPEGYGLAVQLVELCRKSGDRAGVRDGLDRMVRSIPSDMRRVDVYIYALDALLEIGDGPAAAQAAEALSTDCADERDAWGRLELYYGLQRDRRRQIEAGERFRRLGGSRR